MLDATPNTEPPAEKPITERTLAMQKLHSEMQDVTEAVKEIRELLRAQQSAAEKVKQAIKRAINQFMSQL